MSSNKKTGNAYGWLPFVAVNIIVFVVLLIGAELIVRFTEPKLTKHGNNFWRKDPILGFDNVPGIAGMNTAEFKSQRHINAYGMNDDDVKDVEKSGCRIMVVGDSHTAAVGVSYNETYSYLLKKLLFQGNFEKGTTYNCAVAGYGLGQYLLRIRQLEDVVKPNIVIIGFSMATDLYDLIPPRLGGFVYGGTYGRVYFDLDEKGKLTENREFAGKDLVVSLPVESSQVQRSALWHVKDFLESHSFLYRRFKRSPLAVWLAINMFKTESLWPGMSTAVKINLDNNDSYRWALAEELIKKIADESKSKGREVVLVNIPYLPQVYDDVWNASFGQQPQVYDRFIGSARLSAICKRSGVYYIDTTQPFIDEVRLRKRMLHYKQDGHPTAEGHRLIARVIADYFKRNNVIKTLDK